MDTSTTRASSDAWDIRRRPKAITECGLCHLRYVVPRRNEGQVWEAFIVPECGSGMNLAKVFRDLTTALKFYITSSKL